MCKLRHTIICGIPCVKDHNNFESIEEEETNLELQSDKKKNELEDSKYTFAAKPTPTPKFLQKLECCRNTPLRGRVWKVLCKLDEVKENMIQKHNLTQGHSMEPFLRSCLIHRLEE